MAWRRDGVMMRAALMGLGVVMGVGACDQKSLVPSGDDASEQHDDDRSDDDDDDEGQSSGEDDDGATSSPATTGEDCGGQGCPPPGPLPMHAYVIRFGDLPAVDVGEDGGSSAGSGGGGGGSDIDPDSLHVIVSIGPDACDDPYAALACDQWRLSFTLPPDAAPGSYALLDEVMGMQTVTGPDDGNGECWWGGGSLEGTLVIESIDDVAIVGHIEGAPTFDFDANVAFSALRCP
ncbi:MAG: hypothetical protein K1X88_15330 [Nannocystaceae bacterium]|nr:hypothetical protein [Nannocystaceae bacterium]